MSTQAMISVLALALVSGTFAAEPEGNLLENGGFEMAKGTLPAAWRTIYPPGLARAPDFARAAKGAHAGEACASLSAHEALGYSSFTQVVDAPAGATLARLEGWIRVEAEDVKATLILIFFDPERPETEKLLQTTGKLEAGTWKRVEIEAPVPAGATKWMVRCGIQGAGGASFDDIALTSSKEKLDLVPATPAVGRGRYFLVPRADKGDCWVELSIPFPFEMQTPLALRVKSDPDGAVDRLEIRKDRENRPLRVHLKPGLRGRAVHLVAETLVLLRDRPLPESASVPLVKPASIPKEVREHLKAAPGIPIDDPLVKEAVARFSRDDFGALVGDVTRFLREKLEYAGGASQGARECLRSGKAVCTGYANVAATLLIASGVPARILACTQTQGKLQEHYIVEAWSERLGWSRIESTMARFPWPDSQNIIVRIVVPDARRSPVAVPLFVETGGALQGGFDGEPGTGCWQSADSEGPVLLEAKEAEEIEAASRKAFEAAAGKAIRGDSARFLPTAASLKALGPRGARLLETVDAFLPAR